MSKETKYRGHTLGAKNIRIELKKAFPEVKFSVRSESYSGGDHININWTDGPLTDDVEKITGKYQKGDFDGMEDIYNYNHENVWPDVFGGSRYVFENRHGILVGELQFAKDRARFKFRIHQLFPDHQLLGRFLFQKSDEIP